jgi:hypothetical protein
LFGGWQKKVEPYFGYREAQGKDDTTQEKNKILHFVIAKHDGKCGATGNVTVC